MQARRETQAFLNSSTLGQFLQGKPPSAVATIDPAASLEAALKVLTRHRILAAPVMGAARTAAAWASNGNFQGFLEVLDIVGAVVEEWAAENGSSLGLERLRRRLASIGQRLAQTPVVDIPRSNDGQLVYKAHLGMPLLEAARRGFVTPAHKLWCHRLAVFEEDSSGGGPGVRIITVVSQSDIIRHLHRHAAELPALAATPISQLPGVVAMPVASVQRDTPVVKAFQIMLAAGTTAVAVMDGGELITSLSASDLRGMQPQEFGELALPVGDFLLARAAAERTWHLPGSPAAAYGVHAPTPVAALGAPAVCSMDASVAQALQTLAQRQVHRVYLVAPGQAKDSGAIGAPLGVLSTSDLLLALLS